MSIEVPTVILRRRNMKRVRFRTSRPVVLSVGFHRQPLELVAISKPSKRAVSTGGRSVPRDRWGVVVEELEGTHLRRLDRKGHPGRGRVPPYVDASLHAGIRGRSFDKINVAPKNCVQTLRDQASETAAESANDVATSAVA